MTILEGIMNQFDTFTLKPYNKYEIRKKILRGFKGVANENIKTKFDIIIKNIFQLKIID